MRGRWERETGGGIYKKNGRGINREWKKGRGKKR